MVKHYDVYIHSETIPDPIVRTVRAQDPDDAIHRCECAGDLIPAAGDRVLRCILVNCEGRPDPSMHGHLA